MNKELRVTVAEIVRRAGEGHIPSSYSIIDILDVLYGDFLTYDSSNPAWDERDYFVLSKGHGSAALYAVLEKYGFITNSDLFHKSTTAGILGGHPDATRVPGVEASTGSLGHGVVTAMGVALGLRVQRRSNRVVALIGDGESNEGTVWEMAMVAANLELANLCVILDRNMSSDQILKLPNMKERWEAFGWDVQETNGHNQKQIKRTLEAVDFAPVGRPHLILAHTVKGKGVDFMEVHGPWHHRIPSEKDMVEIKRQLR